MLFYVHAHFNENLENIYCVNEKPQMFFREIISTNTQIKTYIQTYITPTTHSPHHIYPTTTQHFVRKHRVNWLICGWPHARSASFSADIKLLKKYLFIERPLVHRLYHTQYMYTYRQMCKDAKLRQNTYMAPTNSESLCSSRWNVR